MTDKSTTTLNALADIVHAIAEDHGWWALDNSPETYPKTLARSVVMRGLEAFEPLQAVEAVRRGRPRQREAMTDRTWELQDRAQPLPLDHLQQLARLVLILGESMEALEAAVERAEPLWFDPKQPDKPEGFGVELADVIIRILDFCAGYGINIDALVNMKIEYNKTRPFRHGNCKI